MEPNKILSANILDLIFDGRNKEYGAYELRVTYPERIKKSMIVVFSIAAVVITGAALANSFKPDKDRTIAYKEVTIQDIKPDEKKAEPIPEKKPEPKPQIQTEKLTQFNVVPDDQADEDIPTKDDLEDARIDVQKTDGVKDDGLADVKVIGEGKDIVETKKEEEPLVWHDVQVPAHYNGDWIKFLTRNLSAEVPVENGAPVGRYNVIIQFIVDQQGNVSDIVPLTKHGFGMEEEAMRVLRKAKGWKAGIQNGHEVKSYHKQPITFVVEDNN